MDRDCVPAVPKPRKRRTESAVGLETEQHGMSLLEFAGPSSSSTAGPPPQFDAARPKQADKGAAERDFLLGRHDLSHVDSKSFVQLFRQGLGNILVSRGCSRFSFRSLLDANLRRILVARAIVALSMESTVCDCTGRDWRFQSRLRLYINSALLY